MNGCKTRFHGSFIKAASFTLLLFTLSSHVYATSTLKVGVVPQFEARKIHAIWQPILDALNKQTSQNFELIGSPNITAFEKKLLNGDFDIAYMNPYHFVMAQEKQGYIPLVRDSSRKLSGILVVRTDSGITSPEELNGKELAFPAPNALGASLQMRQELTDLFGIEFIPRYVKTHDSVYLNVLLKKAAAGGGVGKTLRQQKQGIQEALKILHKTQPVYPHPIAAHPRLGSETIKSIQQSLLVMANNEAGSALLSEIPMRKADIASLEDYQQLYDMKLERFYVSPD